jgi:DNA-3-methyladenine glycosylase I
MHRCEWATDELSVAYHDREWGVPRHDDRILFEFLLLEGAQAGLSWSTILKKREAYRKAFDHFSPVVISKYDKKKVAELLGNPGIVRNRRKILSAVQNAKAFLAVQREFGTFDAYLWSFVGGHTIHNQWRSPNEVPVQTPEAAALSADLKKRGFSFVGPTICYAFMQATGMVNDHTLDCYRHSEILDANSTASPLISGIKETA